MTKYHAVPTVVDGIRFASKGEAGRYKELKLMERSGTIACLELQPRYPLVVNGVKVGEYRADFRYTEIGAGVIVEDFKGVRTPVYRLKRLLVRALYGIEIRETS